MGFLWNKMLEKDSSKMKREPRKGTHGIDTRYTAAADVTYEKWFWKEVEKDLLDLETGFLGN